MEESMTFGDVVLPGLIPLFGAFIGALIANFFPDKTPLKVQGVFYGFIGGFFVSAAFWSMTHYEFMLRIRFEKAAFFVPIAVCFLLGVLLLPTFSAVARIYRGAKGKARTGLRKATKFLIAVAIYSIVRGVAFGVGVSERFSLENESLGLELVWKLSEITALQNLVWGAFVACAFRFSGFSVSKSILFASLVGVATTVAAPSFFLWRGEESPLPFFVFFAGGVMFSLVVDILFTRRAWDEYFSILALLAAYFACFLGMWLVNPF